MPPIKVENTKKLVDHIEINNKKYFADNDRIFHIDDSVSGKVVVSLVSMNLDVIKVYGVDLSKSEVYRTEMNFPKLEHVECSFVPRNDIYKKGLSGSHTSILKMGWVYLYNIAQLAPNFGVEGYSNPFIGYAPDGLVIEGLENNFTVTPYSLNPEIMPDIYERFEMDLNIKGNAVLSKIVPVLTIFDMSTFQMKSKKEQYQAKEILILNQTKSDGSKDVSIKLFFNKRVRAVTNGFDFVFENTLGSTVTINRAELIVKDIYKGVKCDMNILICKNMECKPPESSKYITGCEPDCGDCSLTQTCTEEGKCVNKK